MQQLATANETSSTLEAQRVELQRQLDAALESLRISESTPAQMQEEVRRLTNRLAETTVPDASADVEIRV